ncbi:MAG: hypothetical protein ACOY93_06745 [Bacillota bacterium]
MALAWAAGLHLLQWLAAYLVLDLCFRTIPLEPNGLRERIRAWRGRFVLVALAFTLPAGAAQLWLAGAWGGALGLAGWLPWWILWRFGWRKQFTFLYREDGGLSLPGNRKPDP